MPSDSELQLEIYVDGVWKSVATILPQGDTSRGEGCPTELAYDLDYAAEHFSALHDHALSVRFPVVYEPLVLPHWPPFLLDIFPQGAALRFIEGTREIRRREINRLKEYCKL
jgi:serine/threonine-protein kinase HipA